MDPPVSPMQQARESASATSGEAVLESCCAAAPYGAQAAELAATGRWLWERGWCPASSGNFSLRLDATRLLITASGRDKHALSATDCLVLDHDGQVLGPVGRPSAETGLHLQLYRRFPSCGAVLHTHSVSATVLSRRLGPGADLVLTGYELAKAFPGIASHRVSLRIPIFANDQDIAALAARVAPWLDDTPLPPAYLIAGHGTYTWATDLATCRRQIEALEFLYACALHELGAPPDGVRT